MRCRRCVVRVGILLATCSMNFDRNAYEVEPIDSVIGKGFIRQHHYPHGCHNGPMCWGLWTNEADTRLIGMIAFATPCSENVRASIYGPDYKHEVTELHRLVILDETPCNTESWFIAQALIFLAEYRPQVTAVVSFADPTQGHVGTIYQATNAIYYGTSGKATFYLDGDGRLRHPRQNGVNVTKESALDKGWAPVKREAKHRYLFLIGTPAERRRNRKRILVTPQPYPKL